jgi:hypothetical protein
MVYATTYVLVCDTHKFASMHTLSYTLNIFLLHVIKIHTRCVQTMYRMRWLASPVTNLMNSDTHSWISSLALTETLA